MVATAPATRTRYVNMEPQLEIPAIQGTGLLGASSPLRDDMLTQIAAARASASARSVLPTSNRLASVRLRPEIQERIETRDPAAGLGGGDVKLSCVSVRTLQQLADRPAGAPYALTLATGSQRDATPPSPARARPGSRPASPPGGAGAGLPFGPGSPARDAPPSALSRPGSPEKGGHSYPSQSLAPELSVDMTLASPLQQFGSTSTSATVRERHAQHQRRKVQTRLKAPSYSPGLDEDAPEEFGDAASYTSWGWPAEAKRHSVWKSTTGLGGPHQTSELPISVKSKSIRLIFGRIDRSRGVLEARQKTSRRNRRIRSH